MEFLIGIITFLISAVICIPLGMFLRKKIAESKIQGAEEEAKKLIEMAKNKEKQHKLCGFC